MQIRRYCTQNIFILTFTALFYSRRQAFHRALAVSGHRRASPFQHSQSVKPFAIVRNCRNSPHHQQSETLAIGRNCRNPLHHQQKRNLCGKISVTSTLGNDFQRDPLHIPLFSFGRFRPIYAGRSGAALAETKGKYFSPRPLCADTQRVFFLSP